MINSVNEFVNFKHFIGNKFKPGFDDKSQKIMNIYF